MKDSKIVVKVVCPTADCNNLVMPDLGYIKNADKSGAGAFVSERSALEFICDVCGAIMVRKIFKLNRAETEIEVKSGENA